MNENIKKHWGSLIALAIFALLAAGSLETDTDTAQVQSQAASYTLSANQLYSEYDANEVAADAKYKDRVVVVSGYIQDIGKELAGRAYVVIGGQGFLDGVQCVFTEGEDSTVARLYKGQYISIKGEVSGKGGNVILYKCRLQ